MPQGEDEVLGGHGSNCWRGLPIATAAIAGSLRGARDVGMRECCAAISKGAEEEADLAERQAT